jgi:hypothetical protein
MTLRLNGSSSGYTEIDAPAVAGSNTLVLPTGNGSAGNILGTDGAGNLSWVNGRMVLTTAQNTTSGTNIDFTGIPSWVKKVTVMFNGVSTNGTTPVQIQIGSSGGVESTGYNCNVYSVTGTNTCALGAYASGFVVLGASVTDARVGHLMLTNLSGNTWVGSASIFSSAAAVGGGQGAKILSGTLDRIRLTTVNGTDTFDAGSINILYEG